MAESKFINPLFQRTGQRSQEARPTGLREPSEEPQTTPPTEKTGGGAPVKFTFYFMPGQLERLDDLWVRAKLEHRERVNKSEFVRLALERLMDEFDRDPKAVIAELRRLR